jgi:hypothetical protein
LVRLAITVTGSAIDGVGAVEVIGALDAIDTKIADDAIGG